MTKQEALNKIKELQQYVEGLDKPQIKAGDIYETSSGGGQWIVIIELYDGKYILCGRTIFADGWHRLGVAYSNHPMTKDELQKHLADQNAKLIGTLSYKPLWATKQ